MRHGNNGDDVFADPVIDGERKSLENHSACLGKALRITSGASLIR